MSKKKPRVVLKRVIFSMEDTLRSRTRQELLEESYQKLENLRKEQGEKFDEDYTKHLAKITQDWARAVKEVADLSTVMQAIEWALWGRNYERLNGGEVQMTVLGPTIN